MARRFPTLALCMLAAVVLTACGTFELEMRCEKPETIQSLIVIAGDDSALSKQHSELPGLLRSDLLTTYRTLAQFDPVDEKGGGWNLGNHNPKTDLIKFSTSTGPATLVVDVKHKLAELYPSIALVLIASFKSGEWQSYLVHAKELGNDSKLYLELTSTGFVVRDS